MYLVERPHLQVALDMLDFDLALAVAFQVEDYVDLIEAGTPLIKYNGLNALRLLKQHFANKPVVADLKIMDAADLEVSMASSVGADVVTVMAAAPADTIYIAIRRAHACGIRVIVDLLGVADVVAKAQELKAMAPDFLLLHIGLDQQRQRVSPVDGIEALARATDLSLGIAGGIQVGDISRLLAIRNLDLIVVGAAITSAVHPGEAAREFREALNR
ncbi:MAG: 3-hexulose-6-phosphate synthase [Chloroflexota bacterium]